MSTSSYSKHFRKLHENLSELSMANSVNITLYIYSTSGSILYMQFAAKTVTNVAKVIKLQKL